MLIYGLFIQLASNHQRFLFKIISNIRGLSLSLSFDALFWHALHRNVRVVDGGDIVASSKDSSVLHATQRKGRTHGVCGAGEGCDSPHKLFLAI